MQKINLENIGQICQSLGDVVTLEFPTARLTVDVTELTAADVLAIYSITEGKDAYDVEVNHTANVEAAARAIIEGGKRIFDNPEGRIALNGLPRGILQRIASTALGLSGIDGKQVAKKN